MGSELGWQCVVCGSQYAEYVNGCPHCWNAGLRSKVVRVEDVAKFDGQPTEVLDGK